MELLKSNKKTIIIAAALVLCAALFGSGVMAYLTSSDNATNVWTVGNNTSEIVETWDEPVTLIPGESYTKDVAVTNTGTIDCFVRVFAEIDNPETAAMISIDYNTNSWIKNGQYWYYVKPLAPGETTESLFTTLTVSEFGEEPIDDFAMIVYSESTQKGESVSYSEAFGLK